MSQPQAHITDRELALAANRELLGDRSAAVRLHLDSCGECRARLAGFEAALGEYVEAYHEYLDPQTQNQPEARRRLARSMDGISGERDPWPGWFGPVKTAIAAGAIAASLAGLALLRPFNAEAPNRFAPDASLTPGLTRQVTAAELCAIDTEEAAPSVSRAAAIEVFRRHGITNPTAGAYELDYLIPPELGGAQDDRNLWPQPYQEEPWNAHAKDALEDRLRRLVCDGELELAVAQREIAADWTGAYRKYFETEEPLVIHARFLKDTPWR